jgi:hypothetical protein
VFKCGCCIGADGVQIEQGLTEDAASKEKMQTLFLQYTVLAYKILRHWNLVKSISAANEACTLNVREGDSSSNRSAFRWPVKSRKKLYKM